MEDRTLVERRRKKRNPTTMRAEDPPPLETRWQDLAGDIEDEDNKRIGNKTKKAAALKIPAALVSWLKEMYYEDPDSNISKESVQDEYVEFCRTHQIEAKKGNILGKILKQVFPTVRPRRLGPAFKQRGYYSGLARCSDDQQHAQRAQQHAQHSPATVRPKSPLTTKIRPAPKPRKRRRKSELEEIKEEKKEKVVDEDGEEEEEEEEETGEERKEATVIVKEERQIKQEKVERRRRKGEGEEKEIRTRKHAGGGRGEKEFSDWRDNEGADPDWPSPAVWPEQRSFSTNGGTAVNTVDYFFGSKHPLPFNGLPIKQEPQHYPSVPQLIHNNHYNHNDYNNYHSLPQHGQQQHQQRQMKRDEERRHLSALQSEIAVMTNRVLGKRGSISSAVMDESYLGALWRVRHYMETFTATLWPLIPLDERAIQHASHPYVYTDDGRAEKSIMTLCLHLALYYGALTAGNFHEARNLFMITRQILEHVIDELDLNVPLVLINMASAVFSWCDPAEAAGMAYQYVYAALSICEALNARNSEIYAMCQHMYCVLTHGKEPPVISEVDKSLTVGSATSRYIREVTYICKRLRTALFMVQGLTEYERQEPELVDNVLSLEAHVKEGCKMVEELLGVCLQSILAKLLVLAILAELQYAMDWRDKAVTTSIWFLDLAETVKFPWMCGFTGAVATILLDTHNFLHLERLIALNYPFVELNDSRCFIEKWQEKMHKTRLASQEGIIGDDRFKKLRDSSEGYLGAAVL